MADNDQSKIRYDDFVGKVQSDPANPQATILLAGYVGRGADGHVRIFPDPTLGNWYDVPEADIVHSQPIANSGLGGSHVWIKSNAQIKPGSAAALNPQPLPAMPAPMTTPGGCAPPIPPTWTATCMCQTQPWCPPGPYTIQAVCGRGPGPMPSQIVCMPPDTAPFCLTPQRIQAQPQAIAAQAFQPTPSAVHHCGGVTLHLMCAMPALSAQVCMQTQLTPCMPYPTQATCFTMVGAQCAPPTPNGVFTPFGR